MLKVLEEIKEYALWISKEKKDIKKFEKKATKKKKLTAIFKIIGLPIFQLYVNNKFYGDYYFNGEIWIETKKID